LCGIFHRLLDFLLRFYYDAAFAADDGMARGGRPRRRSASIRTTPFGVSRRWPRKSRRLDQGKRTRTHSPGEQSGPRSREFCAAAAIHRERFNSRFGETFKLPEGVYPEVGARIMDLQEPTNKMSTTIGTEQGTVRLLDEPDVIRKKFRSAVTDSGAEVRRAEDKPGVTNLIDILSALTGESPESIEARYEGSGYGAFKTDVGDAVVEAVLPIQERYRELRADEAELRRLLEVGAEKAAAASAPTLEAMYERMGFVRSSS
jgi:hypothetical protein